MRTATVLLLTLLLAAHAFAAPSELVLGTERVIPGNAWGGAAAANARGTLIAATTADAATVRLLSNMTREVQLPRWSTMASWYEAAPGVAASPSTWLVVWSETINTSTTYLAARVAADLTVLDARPIFLRTTRRDVPVAVPAVVWNGTEWLVVIDTTMARVSLQGVLLEQITLSGTSSVAAAADSVLVASVGQQGFNHCGISLICTFATFYLSGQFLGPHGVVVNAPRFTSAERFRSLLAAGGNDDRFLLASLSGANRTTGVLGATVVTEKGISLPEQIVDVSDDNGVARAAIAPGEGDGFLMAWTTTAFPGGPRLHVARLDEQGRRIGETLLIGGTSEAVGPLSLARISEHRYVLVYPRALSAAAPGLVVREVQFGKNGRGRAVGR